MKKQNKTTRYLTRKEVLGITGRSNPTLWRWTRDGIFPRPYKLGTNSVGWADDEVEAWIASRKKA